MWEKPGNMGNGLDAPDNSLIERRDHIKPVLTVRLLPARPISHSYQLIPRTGSSSSCRVSRAGSLDRASSSADRREPAGVEIATATEHREAPIHRADLRLLVRDDFLGELPH